MRLTEGEKNIMEDIVRDLLGLDLKDLAIMYLVVVISGYIALYIAYEITYCIDEHSKNGNNENERNILQDKDKDNAKN